MLMTRMITLSVIVLAAGISKATPTPEPVPIDPGLQRVVAEKNGMGVVNSTKSTVNSALHCSEVTLLVLSVPVMTAGAAFLVF
ncbi:hypothetical protein F5878DRAFT_665261 [Lentinula raphanica]|uniref:Uncharacterized protein n=1 Tax=Lentinula raphanica TaxID=153919 RepID=A0AA38P061_9AGAR|nr:hypothetical protein F5878DRAFT_665261 [Lentinula raphanica]